jgi:hypothetical protein
MSFLLSLLLLGSSTYEWELPQPYVGFGMSVYKARSKPDFTSQDEDGNFVVNKSRQKAFKIGLPFVFLRSTSDSFGETKLLFLPEFSFDQNHLSLVLAVGPEWDINIGSYGSPLEFFYGIQGGAYYGFIVNDSGLPSKSGRIGLKNSERHEYAFVANSYFGPSFPFGNSKAFRLQFNLQLLLGSLTRHSYRTDFNDLTGLRAAVNAQLVF